MFLISLPLFHVIVFFYSFPFRFTFSRPPFFFSLFYKLPFLPPLSTSLSSNTTSRQANFLSPAKFLLPTRLFLHLSQCPHIPPSHIPQRRPCSWILLRRSAGKGKEEDCAAINSHPSTAPDSSKDSQTHAGSGGENRTRETLKANEFITTFFCAGGSCVEKRVNSEESSLVTSWVS